MKMDKGYTVCDECNGIGFIAPYTFDSTFCRKCRGVGKLNWIENIFGKDLLSKEDFQIREINYINAMKEANVYKKDGLIDG
jgi:hypothetical protein